MFRAIIFMLSVLLLTGCEAVDVRDDIGSDGSAEPTQFNGGVGGSEWSWPTDPSALADELEKSLVTELSRLPLSGDASRESWSAARWKGLDDSTNARWLADEMSPMEKYDAVFNQWETTKSFESLAPFNASRCDVEPYDADYYKLIGPAAEWMSRHRGNWAAHDGLDTDQDKEVDECDDLDGVNTKRALDHAWAAAAMVEHEPIKPVTVAQFTFWPSDIKALLLTVYDNATAFILTGACRAQEIDRTADGVLALKGCEGTSAGDFHVIVTNFIGRFSASIGEELSANGQLISRPIGSYIIDLQRDITATDALGLLGLEASPDAGYSPNPDARGWAEVNLTAYAREHSLVGQENEAGDSNQNIVSFAYHYILELDAEGRVIGGQWLGDDKTQEPPNYLWVAQGPRFQRSLAKATPETVAPGNPFVQYSDVLSLLEESKSENASSSLVVQPTSEGNSDPLPQ